MIETVLDKIDERNEVGVETKLIWVKGHANDEGNVAADALAVRGASSSKARTGGVG